MEEGTVAGPLHVDFNVTNGCNLACLHCHASSGDRRPSELTSNELVTAIDSLHAAGALRIAFGGGEPFFRPDILSILSHACSLPGWRVSVISNGTYLTVRRIEELVACCPGLHVNISLDGPDAGTFGQLRRQPKGTVRSVSNLFDRVVQTIRRVADSPLACSVNMTLTAENWRSLPDVHALVIDDIGADGLVAVKFFPAGFGLKHVHRLNFNFSLWARALLELTEIKRGGRLDGLQLSVPSAWEFYLPFIAAGIDIKEAERVWRYRTPMAEPLYRGMTIADSAGSFEVCVGSNGRIFPSVLLDGNDSADCGDVRQGFLNIWLNSDKLRTFRSVDVADVPGCRTCGLKGLCGGGSRARAFASTHDPWAPDLACPLIADAVT